MEGGLDGSDAADAAGDTAEQGLVDATTVHLPLGFVVGDVFGPALAERIGRERIGRVKILGGRHFFRDHGVRIVIGRTALADLIHLIQLIHFIGPVLLDAVRCTLRRVTVVVRDRFRADVDDGARRIGRVHRRRIGMDRLERHAIG